MQAIRYTRYGSPDVLELVEVDPPTPAAGQVLVKVLAASVNAKDYRMMRADPPLVRLMGGLLRPKDPRLGTDLAGRVEAVGENVTEFQPGDEVFGCAAGAFAEYALARQTYLVKKPGGVAWDEAATLPVAALTALQSLRKVGEIQPGQKVLIHGASGGVGSFAVQLARVLGGEVTAVCSPRSQELARSLGAGRVVDYTREDITRQRQRFDLILAINGYNSLFAYRRILAPQGRYVCAGGTMRQMLEAGLLGPRLSRPGGQTLTSLGMARVTQDELRYLGELHEAGSIRSVIDRSFPLAQVPEAIRYVEDIHPQGKVVINVA
jgi:NADPH:quinone reductase-like Zn-dependent oxidoreductase